MLEEELATILLMGRGQTEAALTAILDDAQVRMPLWYDAVYGAWSDGIAEVSPPMAELFLDLACDVLSVYSAWRGPFPSEDEKASMDFLSQLDLDMKAVSGLTPMHPAFRDHLQGRFEARAATRQYPVPLVEYLEVQVEDYASYGKDRIAALPLTTNLLFILVVWLEEVYFLGGR